MILICKSCSWQGRYEETLSGFCPMCSQQIDLNIDLSEYF